MYYLSSLIIPAIILFILLYSLLQKSLIFDNFIEGAQNGIHTCFKILPTLVGFVTSIYMLKASGFFTIIEGFLSPVFYKIGFPPQLLTLTILRPISGSGSLAVLNDIFSTYGPDSFNGRCASIIMSSTETTFYAITVYFGATKTSVPSKLIKSAILADLTAVMLSITAVKIFF